MFLSNVWAFRGGESNYYRPLMHLFYMLTYQAGGATPWIFHLVNILFHAGASTLVLAITWRLLGSGPVGSPWLSLPFLAALIFAVHPIHTEPVVWVAGLPDVSFALFYLLSLFLYVRSAGEPRWRGRCAALSVLAFFLATLCKEPALTLPFVLVALDAALGRRPWRVVHAVRYVPYAVATAVYLALRFNALRGMAPLRGQHQDLTAYQHVINVIPLAAKYLGKLLVPLDLNVFHVLHPIASLLEPRALVALAAVAAFAFLAVALAFRERLAWFAMALMLLPLAPAFYIPGIGENTFAERYAYLPSAGFVLLVAMALGVWWTLRPAAARPAAAAVIAVAVLYAAGTVSRNRVWKNDMTLWADSVSKSPDGAIPHHELGLAHAAAGRIDEALWHYRAALRYKPGFADAHNNIGAIHLEQGRLDEAIREFQLALQTASYPVRPLIGLGMARLRKGMHEDAIEALQAALARDPDSILARTQLGAAYAAMGSMDAALEQYRLALQSDPGNADVHNSLGIAFAGRGRTTEAIHEFEAAVRSKPDLAAARRNLGLAYDLAGRLDEAAEQFKAVLRLEPDSAADHYCLGAVYMKMGRPGPAVEHLRTAIRINPDDQAARRELDRAMAASGR